MANETQENTSSAKKEVTSLEYVITPNPRMVDHIERYWQMISDLLGGTKSMRDAGERWLPKEPRESTESYNNRLKRSWLFNGFNDTTKTIAAKPFGRAITINGSESDKALVDPYRYDVDGLHTTLERFGKQCIVLGIQYGLVHCIPMFSADRSQTETLAAEEASGARANLLIVHPMNILDWVASRSQDGVEDLEAVRFVEDVDVGDVDTYTSASIQQVRVLTKTEWIVYRYDSEAKGWYEYARGDHTFGSVPLVTAYYGEPIGRMLAVPPMFDLAEANVEHWQSASDQRNILRFARAGTYFAKGFTAEEIEKGIPVGANALAASSNQEADLKVVEWQGNAINAGAKDIESIEERMTALGMKPFITRTGYVTATGRAIDESRQQNAVEEWITVTEHFLERCIKGALHWQAKDVSISSEFSVILDREFAYNLSASTDGNLLLDSVEARFLSERTYLEELKRRGTLSDTVNIEAEIKRIEEDRAKAKRRKEDSDDNLNDNVSTGGDNGSPNAQQSINRRSRTKRPNGDNPIVGNQSRV